MVVDGTAVTGYFAVNFTLAEIGELRLKQRVAGRLPRFPLAAAWLAVSSA